MRQPKILRTPNAQRPFRPLPVPSAQAANKTMRPGKRRNGRPALIRTAGHPDPRREYSAIRVRARGRKVGSGDDAVRCRKGWISRALHGSVPFMRKQYHLWPSGTGFDAWDVRRLISLSRDLPVHAVPVDSVGEVDSVYWFDSSTTAPTVRAVVEHARLMLGADLSFPVILGPDGRVMDGMHRVAKAAMEGHDTISARQFAQDPEPDYVGVDLDKLPY